MSLSVGRVNVRLDRDRFSAWSIVYSLYTHRGKLTPHHYVRLVFCAKMERAAAPQIVAWQLYGINNVGVCLIGWVT